MADKCWIANASPLILLGKAGYLHLLSSLAEVIQVPSAVVREVNVKPEGKSLLDAVEENTQFRIVKDAKVPREILA